MSDAALAQLVEVFPDADPAYIASVLVAAGSVETTMERMLGINYPKRAAPAAAAIIRVPSGSPPPPSRPQKRRAPDDDDLLVPTGISVAPELDPIEGTFKALSPLFPDCEPEHMRQLISQAKGNVSERSQQVSAVLIEKSYPKCAKPATPEIKRSRSAKISPDAVLKKDWYKEDGSTPGANYLQLVLPTLLNRHPRIPKGHVRAVLAHFKNRLALANRQLNADMSMQRPPFKKLKSNRPVEAVPNVTDDLFQQELYFIDHEIALEQEKKDHLLAEELNKKEYEETGQMIECGCCCSEYTFDDMAQCADGHLFCQECCRRGTKELLGLGKTHLLCFQAGCKFTFPLKEVKKFLDEKTFSWYEKAVQDDELRRADIPNLSKCPLCNFAMIIDNPNEKVFKCTQCGKETCRECKEESHIPLRCNEVEKKEVTSARLLIEQKMTEALVRMCPKCKRRFFKEEGCNHMRCQCGTEICYVCRAVIKGYGHFGDPRSGACPQNYDTVQENDAEVEKAAKEAVAAVRRERPDLKDDLEKIAQSLVEGFGGKKKKPKKKSGHHGPAAGGPIFNQEAAWFPAAANLAAMAQLLWRR